MASFVGAAQLAAGVRSWVSRNPRRTGTVDGCHAQALKSRLSKQGFLSALQGQLPTTTRGAGACAPSLSLTFWICAACALMVAVRAAICDSKTFCCAATAALPSINKVAVWNLTGAVVKLLPIQR